jgi:glutathione S-transferase
MRARMALTYAGIELEHREIDLRNKPQSMLLVSPKGTVPVLCVGGIVLEQSLEIMKWALGKSDPDGWGLVDHSIAQTWIEKNDGPFKILLDQYKYPNRDPSITPEEVLRAVNDLMLIPIETALQDSEYLLGKKMSWVDVAIFPFIRQFAMVNPEQFDKLPLPLTKKWLDEQIQSTLFHSVMDKYPTWSD